MLCNGSHVVPHAADLGDDTDSIFERLRSCEALSWSFRTPGCGLSCNFANDGDCALSQSSNPLEPPTADTLRALALRR